MNLAETGAAARQWLCSQRLRGLSWMCAWVLLIAIAALWASQRGGWPSAIGIGVVIVLTAAAVGALLGFLFAIPRVLTKDDDKTTPAPSASGGAQPPVRRLLSSNTNLERVSDWLTTMLVGVGLSQLTSINDGLYRFRQFLTSTTADCGYGKCGTALIPVLGPFLLILGAVIGFLLSYIYTRVVLSEVFHDLEKDLIEAPEAAKAVLDAASTLSKDAENPGLKNLISGDQPSVEDALNVMGNLLYREGGYQQVIDLGGKLSITPARTRAEYWFFLAAAFGQKYKAELAQQSPNSQSSRDNAIDCARRAIAIDPSYRSRLADLAQPGNLDDDLSALREDRDFRALIGAVGPSPGAV